MRRTLHLGPLLAAIISLGVAKQSWAQCAATNTLSFSSRTSGEDWQSRTLAVPAGSATTITSSGYTTSATSANTAFDIETLNNVRTLYWYNDFPDGTGTGRTSSVTFTFNRPVTNLAIAIQDIDAAAGFTDEVSFAGNNDGTAVVPTLSKASTAANSPTLSGTTATGTANVTDNTAGTVTATFAGAVTSITITYNNAANTTTPAGQAVGINQISWCRLAPVANNVTNTAALASSAGQTDIDGPSVTLDGGSVGSYAIAQLPAANEGVLYYYAGLLSGYQPVTTGQSLSQSQFDGLRFDPANTFSGGNTSFRYTVTDNAGQTSNAATFTIPILTVAGPAGCGASFLDGTSHSGLTAEYYDGYFADDMSYFGGRTPALRRFDALLNFTANASWGTWFRPASARAATPTPTTTAPGTAAAFTCPSTAATRST